jgi:hypothetical protein
MKKLILFATAIILSSCDTVVVDPKSEISHRIVGKEHNVYGGHGYQIIEVDGVEYIAVSEGGICPLVKKDSIK